MCHDTNSFNACFRNCTQNIIQCCTTIDFEQRLRRNICRRTLPLAASRREQDSRFDSHCKPSPVSATNTVQGNAGCLAENFFAISAQAVSANSLFANATTQPPYPPPLKRLP